MGCQCSNKFYTSQCSILAEPLGKKKKFTTCILSPEVLFSWKLVTNIRIPAFIIFCLTQFFKVHKCLHRVSWPSFLQCFLKHVCSHHICQHAINVSNPEYCTGFYSTTSAEHHTIKYVVCRINMFGPKC
jgi:hypothetical protein